jgi:hypothetical protein
MRVVALTGKGGGRVGAMLSPADVHLCVPHDRTARIQRYLLTIPACATRRQPCWEGLLRNRFRPGAVGRGPPAQRRGDRPVRTRRRRRRCQRVRWSRGAAYRGRRRQTIELKVSPKPARMGWRRAFERDELQRGVLLSGRPDADRNRFCSSPSARRRCAASRNRGRPGHGPGPYVPTTPTSSAVKRASRIRVVVKIHRSSPNAASSTDGRRLARRARRACGDTSGVTRGQALRVHGLTSRCAVRSRRAAIATADDASRESALARPSSYQRVLTCCIAGCRHPTGARARRRWSWRSIRCVVRRLGKGSDRPLNPLDGGWPCLRSGGGRSGGALRWTPRTT